MIRKVSIGLIAAAACAGASAPAHAASAKTFAVIGHVNSRCSLGTNSAPLHVTTSVPNTGKLPNLEGTSFSLPAVFCSAPSTIKLAATSLRLSPAMIITPPGQSQTVNYTATASNWSPMNATVRTNDLLWIGSTTAYQGTPQSLATAKSATVTVTLTNFTIVNNGNSSKLVSGNYSGTITVTVAPQS